jgi:hypothetical protein
VHTGGAVALNQLFKLAEIFAVPVKCPSHAPTNDAMLCVQDEVQESSMASDTPIGGFSFDLCKRNAFLEGQMGSGAMVR